MMETYDDIVKKTKEDILNQVENIIDDKIKGLSVLRSRRYSTSHVIFIQKQFQKLKKEISEL